MQLGTKHDVEQAVRRNGTFAAHRSSVMADGGMGDGARPVRAANCSPDIWPSYGISAISNQLVADQTRQTERKIPALSAMSG